MKFTKHDLDVLDAISMRRHGTTFAKKIVNGRIYNDNDLIGVFDEGAGAEPALSEDEKKRKKEKEKKNGESEEKPSTEGKTDPMAAIGLKRE